MLSKIEVQLHLWPWSTGIRDDNETLDLMTGAVSFPFFGSPVISVSSRASLFLSHRHERFVPFGPLFRTLGGDYRLYETPHGVLANRASASTELRGIIRVHADGNRETVQLFPQGAKPSFGAKGTELASVVRAWSQMFEDLIAKSNDIKSENKLPWTELDEILHRIAEEIAEPRMALIVDIAARMQAHLPLFVSTARKILFRERRMLPAGRIAETDNACLRWLVRQPGESMALKAAANQQRLLGIARYESFNTLENRVLKDFISRCANEGHRYLNAEVGNSFQLQQSKRARSVKSYCHLCTELRKVPHLEKVAAPPNPIRANYVLQNDYRYKEVWQQYLRLLRREDEEDRSWDWQARTWADVARLLVNSALYQLAHKNSKQSKSELHFEELLASVIHLLKEQHLGSRTAAGSEPGPFLVSRRGKARDQASIIEVVHSDQAEQHPATRLLGRVGGHLYLVLTPFSGARRSVVVIWAVHTAGAERHPSWDEISHSAGRALQNHARNLDELRDPSSPILSGFVVASHMESWAAELTDGVGGGLHLVRIATDNRCWKDGIAGITAIVEDILKGML